MKTRHSCLMVAFAASLAASPSADAGTQEGVKLALHARAHTTKAATICSTWRPTIPCTQYNVQWPVGSEADVYLVVAQAPDSALGIAGVSCGIEYNAAAGVGVDVHGWTLCADIEFPSAGVNGEWPASGGGNRMSWVRTTNCQRTVIPPDGVHAIVGAFHLMAYSSDFFVITANPNLEVPELLVADCNVSMTDLRMDRSSTGWVFFGAPNGCNGGCNPCYYDCEYWCDPVKRSTWGAIKRTY